MKDQKFTYAEFKDLLKLPLGKKIERAEAIIADFTKELNCGVSTTPKEVPK